MNSKWLCFRFDEPFLVELISSILHKEKWTRIKFILISLRPCPNAESHAEFAIRTTKHSPKSKLKHWAKINFYKWQYNWIYRKLQRTNTNRVACMNGLKGVNSLVVAASRELNIPVLFFEMAPLPGRFQIDWKGVNYESSIPRHPNFYRNLDQDQFAVNWREHTPKSRVSKRNPAVKQIKDEADSLSSENYIFCPLQVPTDSQVTVYGGWIKDIPHLLNCLVQLTGSLPKNLHFRIKEHPSSPITFTDQIEKIENSRIILDNLTDTMDLVRGSKGILTINSTVGLEAFYFGKPVITLGNSFYSFGELTAHADNFFQLQELIKNFDSIQFSDSDRDLFMKFLHYWFPTIDSILNKQFTLNDIEERFRFVNMPLDGLN